MVLMAKRFWLLVFALIYAISVRSQCTINTNTVIKPSCSPGCDGQAVITLPNFTDACVPLPTPTAYNVQLVSPCGTGGLSNVGPGTHTVTGLCACGSDYSGTIFDENFNFVGTINDFPLTAPNISTNTPSSRTIACNAACDGSVLINFSGSSVPNNFTIFPTTGSSVVATTTANTFLSVINQCAGILTVQVRDSKNCTASYHFTFTQPAPILSNITFTNVACNGDATGAFVIRPTGGTPNFTVTLNPFGTFTANPTTTLTFNNRPAGVITSTVQDTRGCRLTNTTTITEPATSITIVPTQTNITCFGACTGTGQVAVSGGGTSYTYTWLPGPGSNSVNTALCAGMNTVQIVDNLGCQRSQTFNIATEPAIVPTVALTNILCNGDCTGSASVTATGGSTIGPITYTWVNSTNAVVATGSVVSGLCAGNYSLIARDATNCFTTVPFAINQPATPVSVSVTTQSVTCFGVSNGSAVATAINGSGGPYSFTWSPAVTATVNGASTSTATGLAATIYTISARDVLGCPGSTVITIPGQANYGPVSTINSSSLNCNGVCNGSITITTSGAGGPFNYSITAGGSPTASTGTFTGLCANNYTVTIADAIAGNCTQTIGVATVTQPAQPLVASVNTPTHSSCFGINNGALGGNATGGTSTYTLSWNTPTGSVASGVITNLGPATYTFNVLDFRGCTASQTVAITQPSEMTLTVNSGSLLCSTNTNGTAQAIVAGGDGAQGFSYLWSTGSTLTSVSGLGVGNYTVTVTNGTVAGCSKTNSFSITAPSSITVVPNAAPTRCPGTPDGSATITVSGGTPSYTYTIGSPCPFTGSNTTGQFINVLCSGNYTGNVTDANGCTQGFNFSISSPSALAPTISGVRSSCTSCSGGGTVTVTGGTGPYQYTWTSPSGTATGSVVTNLCPDNYTITVADNNSCIAITNTVISPIIIVTGATTSSLSCFGVPTGSAAVTATGGTTPYTFTWSPTGGSASTATALAAGSYTVRINDQSSPTSCSTSVVVNIAGPSSIAINPTETDITCANTLDGSISTAVTGGAGGYTYSWSPGSQTTSAISGIGQNTYTLVVRDANNCTVTETYTINSPFPAVNGVISSTNPINCTSPNTGSICVSPTGGNTLVPYSFTWLTFTETTSCINNKPAGNYTVVISNSGCSNTLTANLTNPSGPTFTAVSVQSISCFGGNTGAASIGVSGVPNFVFQWSPAVAQASTATTSSITSLTSGSYNFSVTDGNGCVNSTVIVVPQAQDFTITSAFADARCNNSPTGGATIIPTGGTTLSATSYSFNWSNGTSVTGSISVINTFTAGSYTVTVTDNNGCSEVITFSIGEPPPLTISVTGTNITCFNGFNGQAIASASGGTGAIQYTWAPVGSFTGAVTATISNLFPGIYSVSAIDANSCVVSANIAITQPSSAISSTILSTNEVCFGNNNGTATNVATGGTPPYSYTWTAGGSGSVSPLLAPGSHGAIVADALGCTAFNTFTIVAAPNFTMSVTATQPKCTGQCNGSITTVVSGAQGTVNFAWTPTVATGQSPTGLCAGAGGSLVYTLNAIDAAGCTYTTSVAITDPLPLNANASFTSPTCFGQCNGTAAVNPQNAAGSFTATWLPMNVQGVSINTLCGQSISPAYTVTVVDSNSCTATQTVSLLEPAQLSIASSVGPATCGSNNGSITVGGSGGTVPYTYTWLPSPNLPSGSTSPSITGIGAGIYTIIVTDANLCSNTLNIPMSNSDGPLPTLVTTSLSCFNDSNGTASVTNITGGTAPYTVNWLAPLNVATLAVSGLTAGTYSIEIIDNSNCLTYTSAVISQPSSITINPLVTFPSCVGVCDGSITLNTSGGTPGTPSYTYNWTPNVSTTSVVANACGGNYGVVVTDANGCPQTHTFTLPGLNAISLQQPITGNNNNCFLDCNATRSIQVIQTTTTSLTHTTTWSNGQFGDMASALCAGSYTATITDTRGCQTSSVVNVTNPPAITLTHTATEPTCGVCNGSIDAAAGGGTGPSYTYSWNTGAGGNTITSLCAGLYQVQVTDALNCVQVINVPLNNLGGITSESITLTHEDCAANCNGAATIIPVGGSAPIQFLWVNPFVPSTVNSADSLCAGVYFVQMTDAQNCVRTASFNINAGTTLTVSPFVVPPDCPPAPPTGSINVVVSGGAIPYSYSWSPSAANTPTLNNLGVGSYTVVVTEAGGCSRSEIINISNPNGPEILSESVSSAFCGLNNGSLSIVIRTGTATPVVRFSNGEPAQQTTVPALTNLPPGIITLTISYGLTGCTTIRSYTIGQDPILIITSNEQPVACNNDCNGEIVVIPTGGQLTYSFTWSTGTSTANSISGLCSGNYTATVIDAKGCRVDTTISLNNPSAITPSINVIDASCSSVADGGAGVTVSGGTAPFTYTWSGPNGFAASTSSLSNVLAGNYSLQLSDQSGCVGTGTVDINSTIVNIASAGADASLCPGSSAVLSGTNSSGSAPLSYRWIADLSDSQTPFVSTPTLLLSEPQGTTTIILETQIQNCRDSDMVNVIVYEEPFLDAGETQTVTMYSSIQLGGNPTTFGPGTVTWTPANMLSDMNGFNPVVMTNTDVLSFTVSLAYGDGCLVSDTLKVFLYPEIIIASGLSPNGDGKNDVWNIQFINKFPENNVEVYNRWGDLLFTSAGYETAWDGTYKGQPLPVGTYYYVIRLNHPIFNKPYTGPVTIFR